MFGVIQFAVIGRGKIPETVAALAKPARTVLSDGLDRWNLWTCEVVTVLTCVCVGVSLSLSSFLGGINELYVTPRPPRVTRWAACAL